MKQKIHIRLLTLCALIAIGSINTYMKKPIVEKDTNAGLTLPTGFKAVKIADGRGVQNLNPPLNNTSYVTGPKQKLINVLLNGLKQQKVNGETYSNATPAVNYLTNKQIADVLTYARNSFGNKVSPISPSEVA